MNHQTLQLDDNRTFAWRETGEGTPLVLVHGWSMSSAVFAEALAELSSDFRVLAPDLRGHGFSSPGDVYHLEALANDLLQWLDALGISQTHLLGWSLGGQVCMQLASRAPERVEKLALVCSTPRFCSGDDWEGGLSPTQVRAMERNLKRNFLGTMGDFFFSMFAGEQHPPERYRQILKESVRSVPQIDPKVSVGGLLTLRDSDLRTVAAQLKLPVLVHYGALDTITPRLAGDWLAENIPGATRVCDDLCGHAPFFSRPGETFAMWREYFA
ncbi:MAG: O-methylpimelyl-ACP methylesterase [Desulfuromonas sp.]|nr:MAG: O-methylpimelyl-ACP methylesterase [Desulfuromonas sp.]